MWSGQGAPPLLPRFSLSLLPVCKTAFGSFFGSICYSFYLFWCWSSDCSAQLYTAAAVQLKFGERFCAVHMKYSHVHRHKVHAILDNPPQEKTGLLWFPGNIPVKFSHSSGGGFALPECFKADPESWFQSLPLPTYMGKHVHVWVHENTLCMY